MPACTARKPCKAISNHSPLRGLQDRSEEWGVVRPRKVSRKVYGAMSDSTCCINFCGGSSLGGGIWGGNFGDCRRDAVWLDSDRSILRMQFRSG